MRHPSLLIILAAALVLACGDDATVADPTSPTQAALAAATPDISGVWNYAEETALVVKPGDEVIHASCTSPEGVLTIQQNGTSFTGTLVHPSGICRLKDGAVVPPPWPLPYEATITGRISGRALHIDQVDAETSCSKNGRIELEGGEAVRLTTVGRCDLSFSPFRPATASNSATATR